MSTAFWRLQEALEYRESLPDSEDYHVFSFQVSRSGGRKFQVSRLDRFWDTYRDLDPKYNYEVLRSGVKTKLYYDIEFYSNLNPDKDGHEMVKRLIQLNIQKLAEFGHETDETQVMVLESFYKQKFSVHLVFVNTVFSNNQEVGGFIENLISTLTPEEKQVFTIQDERGKQQLFIDRSVYKPNQQIRLFQSRKLGRQNPLIISTISKSKYKDFSKESFFASLITKIDSQTAVLKIELKEGQAVSSASRSVSFSSGESPYIEIDQVITDLISPGRISGWAHYASSNTYCFSVVNYSFCRNVKRAHSNAKVYFLYCLSNNTLWQQCFAEKCKGFKSDPIKTPDFGWLADMEPWSV